MKKLTQYIPPALILSMCLAGLAGALSAARSQTTPVYPASFEDCRPDSTSNICFYVDVATPLTVNPNDEFPQRVQFLHPVKVTVKWSNGWFGSTKKTLTTDAKGRVVFMVPKNKAITMSSDASDLLVAGTNATSGLPEPHRYIDKSYPITSQPMNQRYMMVLHVNPQVATLPK